MAGGADWLAATGLTTEDVFQGTLSLGTQGCSFETLLIVTGPYRGRVVNVDGELSGPPYLTRDADFLAWYERWLDELLWGFDVRWFGWGLPGREADMAAALAAPDQLPDVAADALVTLRRMPALEPGTLELVRDLAAHPAAGVRRIALQLLGKHGHPATFAAAVAALGDPVAEVRKAAVGVAAATARDGWATAVRPALADPDRGVAFRALCVLKNAAALTPADLRPLLASPAADARRHGLWAATPPQFIVASVDAETHRRRVEAARALADGIADEAVRLLADADASVRREAINVIRGRPTAVAVPLLLSRLADEADPQVLCIVVRALGGIADPSAVRPLLSLASHADAFVRLDVARAVGRLGDTAAVDALTRLAADSTKPERRDAAGRRVMSNFYTVGDVARTALAELNRRNPRRRD